MTTEEKIEKKEKVTKEMKGMALAAAGIFLGVALASFNGEDLSFNSVSTAMEREEMENREGRVQLATGMAQLVGLMDQEWLGVDKNAFENFLFTDIMKVDEAKFKIMFPKKLAEAAAKKATEEAAAKEKEKSGGGEALMESARSIQGYIDSFYS